MKIVNRNAQTVRRIPSGETVEDLRDSTRASILDIHDAISRLENGSFSEWENASLSGTWTVTSGSRIAQARQFAPGLVSLIGRLDQATVGNIETQCLTLPPALRPRFASLVGTVGRHASGTVPVILTINTDGSIVPDWPAAGTGTHVLYLDGVVFTTV